MYYTDVLYCNGFFLAGLVVFLLEVLSFIGQSSHHCESTSPTILAEDNQSNPKNFKDKLEGIFAHVFFGCHFLSEWVPMTGKVIPFWQNGCQWQE